MQIVDLSSYGLHPTLSSDPSTPRLDKSHVQFSSFFNSEFKFLLTCQTFMLHGGSHTGPTPVISWGGSPVAGQTSMWPPPPPVGHPGQSSSSPLSPSGQRYLRASPPPPREQALLWRMPLWTTLTPQRPSSPPTVRHIFVHFNSYIHNLSQC
jgi:hypothetical protein